MQKLKINSILAINCICFYHLTALAVSQPVATKIQKMIDQSLINPKKLGLMVSRADRVIFRLNDQKLFIPASLTKIFTTGVLLDSLSPNLQFSTKFLSLKPLNGSILKGDLYLLGGGDPSFVSESLWNLVNNVLRTGLKKVTGNLVVDRSYFNCKHSNRYPYSHSYPHSYPYSYPQKKWLLPQAYSAPTGALSFNWNTANFYLRPGTKLGHPLKVVIDPSPLYFTEVINRTKTTSIGSPAKNIRISMTHMGQKKRQVIITGKIGLDRKELLLYRSITEPALWTGWNAIAFLKQRGIEVKGRVQDKSLDKNKSYHLLAEWKGKSLIENLRLMMKYSNNYMTEMLIKNLATQQTGQAGTLKTGIKILKKHIREKLNISSTHYQLVEASGLSRSNRFQVRHLWTALNYWSKHPLQAEFESTLPLAGYDGTLKGRFVNSNIKGHLHAKTGHLSGVTGLAGYINAPNRKKQIFVFIFNGSKKQTPKAEKLFDQLAQILFESKN